MPRYMSPAEASVIPDLVPQDLSDLLQRHYPSRSVAALCATMLESDVSGDIFLGLTENDFTELGLKDVIARRWIMSAINSCKAHQDSFGATFGCVPHVTEIPNAGKSFTMDVHIDIRTK